MTVHDLMKRLMFLPPETVVMISQGDIGYGGNVCFPIMATHPAGEDDMVYDPDTGKYLPIPDPTTSFILESEGSC